MVRLTVFSTSGVTSRYAAKVSVALRRGSDLGFGEYADFCLENFSRPPFRAPKTHEVNGRALKQLEGSVRNDENSQN